MNNRYNVSDDVLVKHLLGEATDAERMEVQQWVATSAENRKYYEDFKLIWEESKKLEPQTTVDTEEAWGRFVQRVEKDEQQAAQVPASPARTIPLWSPRSLVRVAAMLVIMVGAGWLIYNVADGGDQMMVASADKVLKHVLPDGSMVTLNKNSSLAYSGKFEGRTRNVKLTGEAFFDVAPDKSKPFVIDAGNSSVTVVGTSFNVKNRKEITEVIVESGIVEVAKKQKAVRLLPGQRATVSAANDAPVMEQTTDVLYNYYRTGVFVCDGVPLYKLVSMLNEAFNAQIELGDSKLAGLSISTTLQTKDLNEALDVVCQTLKLRRERTGGKIILKQGTLSE